MLFIMEPNNNTGDLEFFISYIRKQITAKCNADSVVSVLIMEDLLSVVAEHFAQSPSISFILRNNLDRSSEALGDYLEEILTVVDSPVKWEEYREHFLAEKQKYII